MDLSKKDRLFLYNQYEILKLLNSKDKYMVEQYEEYQDILQNGYKYNYDTLIEWVLEDTPDEVSKFVWEVFNMFRALSNSYLELEEDQKAQINLNDIKFQGYDGNEEGEYYSYSNFILEKMKRYHEIYDNGKVELNSHSHMVPTYGKMLDAWIKVRGEKYSTLTLKQINEIIEAKEYY